MGRRRRSCSSKDTCSQPFGAWWEFPILKGHWLTVSAKRLPEYIMALAVNHSRSFCFHGPTKMNWSSMAHFRCPPRMCPAWPAAWAFQWGSDFDWSKQGPFPFEKTEEVTYKQEESAHRRPSPVEGPKLLIAHSVLLIFVTSPSFLFLNILPCARGWFWQPTGCTEKNHGKPSQALREPHILIMFLWNHHCGFV